MYHILCDLHSCTAAKEDRELNSRGKPATKKMSMLKVQYIKVLKQLYRLYLPKYIYERNGIIYYGLYDFDSELSR
jgi:hypothetical protein